MPGNSQDSCNNGNDTNNRRDDHDGPSSGGGSNNQQGSGSNHQSNSNSSNPGGSPLVQDNSLETQPQEERILVLSLSTALAPTLRLVHSLKIALTLNLNLTLVLHLHHTHNLDLLRDPKFITILQAHLSQHRPQPWNNNQAQPRIVTSQCNHIGYRQCRQHKGRRPRQSS